MKHTPMPARKAPMKRTPFRSSSLPGPRSKGIRRKQRTAAEKERIYGIEARIEWSKAQPCVVPGCGVTPTEIIHVCSGGTGRKADADQTTHLCAEHHREEHRGTLSFQARHGISLAECAARSDANWHATKR